MVSDLAVARDLCHHRRQRCDPCLHTPSKPLPLETRAVSQWNPLLRFDITRCNRSALKQSKTDYYDRSCADVIIIPLDVDRQDMNTKVLFQPLSFHWRPNKSPFDPLGPPTSPRLANRPPRAPQVRTAACDPLRKRMPFALLPGRLPLRRAGVTCLRRRNLE